MPRTTTVAAVLVLLAPLAAAQPALGEALRCSNAYHPFGPTMQRAYQLISEEVLLSHLRLNENCTRNSLYGRFDWPKL